MIHGHPLDHAMLPAEFSSDVRRLVEDVPDEGARTNRAVVAALVWRTLRLFVEAGHQRVPAFVLLPGITAVTAAVTFGVVLGVDAALDLVAPADVGRAITTILALVVYVAAVSAVVPWRGHVVDLGSGPTVDRLRLGRFEVIFSNRSRTRAAVVLGLLFGLHLGLPMGAPAVVGLEPIDPEGTAWLVADNVCHGWLFDVCELYDIRIGGPESYGTLAATVLLMFRLGFDLVLAVLVYSVFERRSAGSLLQRLAPEFDEHQFAVWLEDVLRSRAAWTRWFPDEALFLMLVRDYTEGRLDDVRETAISFPHLRVSDRLKGYFVDDFGAPLWLAPKEATALSQGPVELTTFESASTRQEDLDNEEVPIELVDTPAEDDDSEFDIELVRAPDD